MGYGKPFSGAGMEQASKIGHAQIVRDPQIREFLSRCNMPQADCGVEELQARLRTAETPQRNPVDIIVAVDGGFTDVPVRREFPSATLAAFMFGPMLLKLDDLRNLTDKEFVHPDDMARLNQMERLKLILPTRQISLEGEGGLTASVRRTIYEFFMRDNQLASQPLMQTLRWLVFEEFRGSGLQEWELASCPWCGHRGIPISASALDQRYTLPCPHPHCRRPIYLSDVLRLHETIDDELGAGGILGYLSTAIEQLIVVHFIRCLLERCPRLLSKIMFVRDGPLAFFGQTANLHRPMRRLIAYLAAHHDIFMVGVEKHGPFVEHAQHIREHLANGQFLLLDNDYIYRYILPRRSQDEQKPYGSSTYFGHKLIYRSDHEHVFVLTLPSAELKKKPEPDDCINYQIILENMTTLRCDSFAGSLIPVVLANKLVSLSNHPGTDILKKLFRQYINT